MGPPLPVPSGQRLSSPLGRSQPLCAVGGQGGDEAGGAGVELSLPFLCCCGSVFGLLSTSVSSSVQGVGGQPLYSQVPVVV